MQEVEPARLDSVQLFEGLDESLMRDVERRVVWRRYARNEQILGRDSDSRDLYFVVTGSVQVKNFSFSGREIALARVGAGGYFGELSAIDNEPRSASVIAAEPCLLASMSPTAFQELLAKRPDVARRVMQRLARIIRICDERIMDLSTLGAVQRVYVELLRLAKPDAAVPSLWSIYPMPTQADIAGRASTTRETVARVLSQLTNAGIVTRKSKTVYLQEREKLQVMAERLEPELNDVATR